MSSSALGRMAVICLAILPAAAVPARAGEFFHNLFHCRDCCAETQRVTIPGQQVEVVAEQPRVVVREVAPRVVHRTAAVGAVPVPIGTVYLPMTFQTPVSVPMVGACAPAAGVGVSESVDQNPLAVAHRAELMALRSEQARSELQATVAAHQRVLQRIAAGSTPLASGTDVLSSQNVEQRLNQLSSDLAQLTNRVSSVERLLIIHDNVLKAKVVGASGPGASPDSTLGPGKPTVSNPPISTPPKMTYPEKSPGDASKLGSPPVMMGPAK